MMTPLEEIENFLRNLPSTIHDWITHTTAIYYTGNMLTSPEHAESVLFQALHPTGQILEMHNILLLRAAIDYLLADNPIGDEAGRRILTAAIEKFDDAAIRAMLAQKPLQRAHKQQAQERWAALKSNQLSDQEIQRFERTRLMSN